MEIGAEPSVRVCQASGMVSVQADCTLDEALMFMNDRAQIHRTLEDIAKGVVERRIRFG